MNKNPGGKYHWCRFKYMTIHQGVVSNNGKKQCCVRRLPAPPSSRTAPAPSYLLSPHPVPGEAAEHCVSTGPCAQVGDLEEAVGCSLTQPWVVLNIWRIEREAGGSLTLCLSNKKSFKKYINFHLKGKSK